MRRALLVEIAGSDDSVDESRVLAVGDVEDPAAACVVRSRPMMTRWLCGCAIFGERNAFQLPRLPAAAVVVDPPCHAPRCRDLALW